MTESITFIICYDDENYLEECVYYIKRLHVPRGMEIDILGVQGVLNLTSGYNAAMKDSNAKYKIYLDQRTFIINEFFLTDLLGVFRENPRVGMIGISGSSIESGELDRGRMLIWGNDKIKEINMQSKEALEPVCSLGNMLIATQYDLEWGNKIEEQCHIARKMGYSVAVPYQSYSWCLYDSRTGCTGERLDYTFHLCRVEMCHDMESARMIEQLLERGIISYEEHMQNAEGMAYAETIVGYFWEDFLLSGKKRSKYLPADGTVWMDKEKNHMNVVAAFNHNYAEYAMVMLQSLYMNNQLCEICVHILQCDLIEKDKEAIEEQAGKFANKVIFYTFNQAWLPEGIKVTAEWSVEAYFRLYMVDLLPEWVDRALYLDVYIIVNKPIYDYYFMNMNDYDIVACRDFSRVLNEKFTDKRRELFANISEEETFTYFNSGVMLMDLDTLRRKVKGEDYLKVIGELKGKLLAPDQDILNTVHWKDTGLVDEWKFDFFNACLKGLQEREANQHTTIVHYAGPKPWMPIDTGMHAHKLWWKYAQYLPVHSKTMEILFIRQENREETDIVREFRQSGHQVTEYKMGDNTEEEYTYLLRQLQSKTYHFICSDNFVEMIAHAAYSSGTKYVVIQLNCSSQSLFSVYITYATNYIFLHDAVLYNKFREEGFRTVYQLMSGDLVEKIVETCFTEEELDIYHSIFELERYWRENGQPLKEKNYRLEDVYRSFALEKKYFLSLKEKVVKHIDKLLICRSMAAWEEILVWYNRNVIRDFRVIFWELYIFNIILSVYIKERQQYYDTGEHISVLNFENMEEILNYYFRLLFLLRRIEYDILPEAYQEICLCIQEKGVSDT